jgi:replicative DNA helicase
VSGRDAPPHDIATEQAVLGSMMLSADSLATCLELLRPGPEVFWRPAHQLMFEAVSYLAAEDEPVDALTVRAEMERRKTLAKAGGADYLHACLAAVPVPASGPAYARDLLDLHMRRSLHSASQTIAQIATDPGDRSRSEMAEAAYTVLDRVAGHTAEAMPASVASLLLPIIDALEAGRSAATGVPSGWRDLDRVIPGFRPGELVVVGGRPGMGKSIILLGIAAYTGIVRQRPTLMCSLEMSKDECMERLLSSFAEVPLASIRDCVLTSHDWDKIAKVQPQLSAADTLLIEDSADLTIHDIRGMLRAMARAGQPAELLAVDYLQLMGASGKRPENRQLEVSEISRNLKKLAKEFAIPVLVGSQVNRGPELRSDHRPLPADLRESGSLENDCDIAILLYRDDVYYDDSAHTGEIDLIIAKNRQGPKTTIPLAFRGHFAMCADLYREAY